MHSKEFSVAAFYRSPLYGAIVGTLRLEQEFVFVLYRSWQAFIPLMT
jgi:hypothetical protein